MSLKVIAYLHPANTDRIEKEYENPHTVAWFIRDISPVPPGRAGWVVMINDEPARDFSRIVNDGDTLYIRLMPLGDMDAREKKAAGMKAGGWGMVIAGTASFFIPFAGALLGPALVGAGLGLAMGGQVLLNMDIPSMGEREKPEQDPSIRGSRNQSRPLGYIPILLGRRRIYADIAAKSYTRIEGGKQYLYQLFCLGQKDMEIERDSFKINETLIKDYSATGDIGRILDGTDELINITVSQGGRSPLFFAMRTRRAAPVGPEPSNGRRAGRLRYQDWP